MFISYIIYGVYLLNLYIMYIYMSYNSILAYFSHENFYILSYTKTKF